MKTKLWTTLISLCVMFAIFNAGLAEGAGTGTLKFTFKYKDPTTQVDQNLNYGYIYLHDAAKPAPMEKFLSKADYILGGPASTINGKITAPVPAGKYYIRVLQRKVVGGVTRPYGPPEAGDLTWFQTTPITITAGATLDLGTKYANPFGTAITITGSVKNYSGVPLAGRYVRATTVPCVETNYCTNDGAYCDQWTNQCGTVKFMALQPTDANGTYTLQLRGPGTYYLSTITSWDTTIGCSGYCAPAIIGTGYSPQAITVQTGDSKTVNLVGY